MIDGSAPRPAHVLADLARGVDYVIRPPLELNPPEAAAYRRVIASAVRPDSGDHPHHPLDKPEFPDPLGIGSDRPGNWDVAFSTSPRRMFVLDRPGPAGSGSLKITYLGGGRARPRRAGPAGPEMTAVPPFAEMEVDDVAVPAAARIGPEGQGWTTLGRERSTAVAVAGQPYRRVTSARLLDWTGRRALPGVLADLRLHALAADLLGEAASLTPGALDRPGTAWMCGFLDTLAITIGVGAALIQRTTIAAREPGSLATREETR